MNMSKPDFSRELFHLEQGREFVCGVDEAGRGPWAGPVVAAAVIFKPDANSNLTAGSIPYSIPAGLDDSKRLTSDARSALYDKIVDCSIWATGIADITRIDQMNILHSSLWAMSEAVKALSQQPDFVLVDGNKLPDFQGINAETIVKGDQKSVSIAAASIVAKVTRDRMMEQLDIEFPEYCWASNKGYGTKAHQEALSSHGVTVHHRRSFKPIKALL